MVDRAQSQPIRDLVRTSLGVPKDVGRFQTKNIVGQSCIVPTHSASIRIGLDHFVTESRIAWKTMNHASLVVVRQRQPYGFQDPVVVALFEFTLQEQVRRTRN